MTNVEGMTELKPRSLSGEDAFWNVDERPLIREEAPNARVYDLEERTAKFGEAVIDFAKTIPQSPVTSRLISQFAATSVGAIYGEADDAISRKGIF